LAQRRGPAASAAATICGHSQQIAQEHHWTVTASDLTTAGILFDTTPSGNFYFPGNRNSEVKTEAVNYRNG
jgi:hypothetical protein